MVGNNYNLTQKEKTISRSVGNDSCIQVGKRGIVVDSDNDYNCEIDNIYKKITNSK